jgi:hypothetical protein
MSSSTKELTALHDLLAKTLSDMIRNGVEGEAASASVLNVARQFLKDNNITADLKSNQGLQSLAETVPFTDVDEHGLPKLN